MGALVRGILVLFFSLIVSQADLLYRNASPVYPAPSFGVKDLAWDNALQSTLTGYNSRFIAPFPTGLVHDPIATSTSVSEAMGYGLLLFLWGDQRTSFDALCNASLSKQKANKLFPWRIDSTGVVTGAGGATDGDCDVALALVFADRLKKMVTQLGIPPSITAPRRRRLLTPFMCNMFPTTICILMIKTFSRMTSIPPILHLPPLKYSRSSIRLPPTTGRVLSTKAIHS